MAQTPLSRQAQPGDFLLVIRTCLTLHIAAYHGIADRPFSYFRR